jgi:hypothetical protein
MENGTDPHPAAADGDPTAGQIEERHPGWKLWQDAHHAWYAQGPPTACPVLTDENLTELEARIASWEDLHGHPGHAAQLDTIRPAWDSQHSLWWAHGQYHARHHDGGPPLSSRTIRGLVRLLEDGASGHAGR